MKDDFEILVIEQLSRISKYADSQRKLNDIQDKRICALSKAAGALFLACFGLAAAVFVLSLTRVL